MFCKKVATSVVAYGSSLQMSVHCCFWKAIRILRKIWQKHDAAQFSNQNLLAYPTTNSHIISKVMNSSISILMNHSIWQQSQALWSFVPPCVFIAINGCPTIFELNMLFKHCVAHAFFPEHFFNHCQCLHHTFPEIFKKSDACSLCLIHHKIPTAPNVRMWKVSMSTHFVKLCTDSHSILILTSAVASC